MMDVKDIYYKRDDDVMGLAENIHIYKPSQLGSLAPGYIYQQILSQIPLPKKKKNTKSPYKTKHNRYRKKLAKKQK